MEAFHFFVVYTGFTPEGSDVGSPVREEREEEEVTDGVDLMKQVLFPDSDGSEEESDWIVSDFEDFHLSSPSQGLSLEEVSPNVRNSHVLIPCHWFHSIPVTLEWNHENSPVTLEWNHENSPVDFPSFSLPQGHSEQERSWKDTLSVKGVFGLVSELIDIDQWLDSDRAGISANERDEDGVLPLAYVAGCAHHATFHTLLPHTDLEMLQSILTAKGTSLLPIIVEAPLTRVTAKEDRAADVVAPADLKDSASLECLEALWNHNRFVAMFVAML